MKIWIILALGVGVPLLLWVGWGAYVILTTERPPYEVLRRLPSNVEIRQYGAQTWISTDYEGDDSAFRVLASYIFGENEQGKKIAMTAPVITGEKMVFILPEHVTLDAAPEPGGQPIEFSEIPPRKLAALQFSWTTAPKRVEKKREQLMAVLRASGVQTKGRPFLMRYNDPATPPFMRRNEVAIEVE
jgi:hypothetical protein